MYYECMLCSRLTLASKAPDTPVRRKYGYFILSLRVGDDARGDSVVAGYEEVSSATGFDVQLDIGPRVPVSQKSLIVMHCGILKHILYNSPSYLLLALSDACGNHC